MGRLLGRATELPLLGVFGLARASSTWRCRSSNQARQHARYMAPEQRVVGARVTSATDVYQMAASLWDFLTGSRAVLTNILHFPARVVVTERQPVVTLAHERLPDACAKIRILRALDRAREFVRLRALLRFLRVSPSRFHAGQRLEQACALDDQSPVRAARPIDSPDPKSGRSRRW